MKFRIERRRLYTIFGVMTVTLIGGGVSAARSGNHALESVLVACRSMIFLFGEHLSWGTAILIALFALLLSGIASSIFGFVKDVLTLRVLENKAKKNAIRLKNTSTPIYLTKNIPHQAWTSGIFSPRIYIASESYAHLTKRERKALIAHECAHIHHKDVLKRVVGNGLRRLFWYIPTIGEVVEIIRFEQEVRADHVAVKVAGKRALCSLYLSSSVTALPAHASGFAFATPRLREVLEGKTLKAELSTSRLVVSFCMMSVILFGGWGGFVRDVRAEAPATCAIIETMAPQSFTALVGPLELHTPNPENACNENLSC